MRWRVCRLEIEARQSGGPLAIAQARKCARDRLTHSLNSESRQKKSTSVLVVLSSPLRLMADIILFVTHLRDAMEHVTQWGICDVCAQISTPSGTRWQGHFTWSQQGWFFLHSIGRRALFGSSVKSSTLSCRSVQMHTVINAKQYFQGKNAVITGWVLQDFAPCCESLPHITCARLGRKTSVDLKYNIFGSRQAPRMRKSKTFGAEIPPTVSLLCKDEKKGICGSITGY